MDTLTDYMPTSNQHNAESRLSLHAEDAEQAHSRLLPPDPLEEATTPSDAITDVNDPPPEPALSSTGNRTPEQQSEKDVLPPHTRTRSIYFDWWEEIASVATSLICMVLALTILLYMNNKSMAKWKLLVQPNTVVAFLATLIRATLIFPLAECLGHLKWTFFEQPRTLDFMNSFDVASRGPLGASKFLWHANIKSPLSACAAFTIILLLFFQPFMQQTIEVAARSAPMSNETAYATRATSYEGLEENSWPMLSYRVFKTVTGDAGDASDAFETHCSTPVCEYPEFDTLAVCAVCEDHVLSGSVLGDANNCTFTNNATGREIVQPSLQDIRSEVEELRWHEAFHANLSCTQDPFPFSMILENYFMTGNRLPMTRITLYPFGNLEYQDSKFLLGDHAEWFWNVTGPEWQNEYTTSPEIAGLRVCKHIEARSWSAPFYESYNYILDSICFNKTTDLWRYFHGDQITPQFGEVNGTVTTCSLKPCVKHYGTGKTRGNRMSVDVDHLTLDFRNATDQPDIERLFPDKPLEEEWYWVHITRDPIHYCTSKSIECPFRWRSSQLHTLGSRIKGTLESPEFFELLTTAPSAYNDNFTELFERIAWETSGMIQSSANLNATNTTGVAYGTELYVRVRWPWLVMPVLTFIASITILCLTIRDSSKRSYLFKNKILAAIAFDLHAWEGEECGTNDVWERETIRRLEESSKRIVVRMQLPDGTGQRLKLKQE